MVKDEKYLFKIIVKLMQVRVINFRIIKCAWHLDNLEIMKKPERACYSPVEMRQDH